MQPAQAPLRLEGQIPTSCPRCSATVPRAELGQHLWTAHRLLLVGRRLIEPWAVIRLRVADCQTADDVDRLAPCFELCRLLDPAHGETRLNRLLAAGVARDDLDTAAASRGGAPCPGCFGLVPVENALTVPPLTLAHGRLAAGGYIVEVSERGWQPRLWIETPATVVFRGTEPEQMLTPRGRLWLAAGPPVIAALLLAVGFAVLGRDSVGPVLLLLGLALALAARVGFRGPKRAATTDRAIDHAWKLLVPRLRPEKDADLAFLAALAATSRGRGQPDVRAQVLHQVVGQIERGLADDHRWLAAVAPLWHLVCDDAYRQDRDAVALAARLLSRCLEGELPGEAAEALLHDWQCDWWTAAARSRLRILLADRAFDADLEIADLQAAADRAPALAEVLGASTGLAQLRLLWLLRTQRPWDRCGDAFTAFEIAGQGGRQLERTPDLLLYQLVSGWPPNRTGPLAIALCARGVWFQETLFTAPPHEVEVHERGGGFELILGPCEFTFRDDPTDLARLLERWFTFYFQEFLPRSAVLLNRPPARSWPPVAQPARVRCPDCRETFVPQSRSER